MKAQPPREDDAERDSAYAAAVRRLVAEMIRDPEATTELETLAALLIEVGRDLLAGTECVIAVVPPDRQDVFRVVGGA
ncbi:MAG TPA: hypothetical protein VIN56_06015, partial [Candidatus Dormibacteraeota bacterium]